MTSPITTDASNVACAAYRPTALDSIDPSTSDLLSRLSMLSARWRRWALGGVAVAVASGGGRSKVGPGSCAGRVGVCGRNDTVAA